MVALEQDHSETTDIDQETELNRKKYEQVMVLLEGNSEVRIETDTHTIQIEPEEFCKLEGGCLDISIEQTTNDNISRPFDYHVNRNLGIVEYGVSGNILAIESGIPGGGSVYFEAFIKPEDHDDDDPVNKLLDWGKLSDFIVGQAQIGKRTFRKPTN